MRNGMIAGSMLPQRVPIGTPSSGVRPIEVSMHLPPFTALRLEPLPRWQVITRVCSFGMSSFWIARPATYRCEVPWNP